MVGVHSKRRKDALMSSCAFGEASRSLLVTAVGDLSADTVRAARRLLESDFVNTDAFVETLYHSLTHRGR
jgi:N-formylglutamate amidohydrolase